MTIGSGESPSKIALLDMKSQNNESGGITTTKGGVLLPRVELQEINSLKPFIFDEGADADKRVNCV